MFNKPRLNGQHLTPYLELFKAFRAEEVSLRAFGQMVFALNGMPGLWTDEIEDVRSGLFWLFENADFHEGPLTEEERQTLENLMERMEAISARFWNHPSS